MLHERIIYVVLTYSINIPGLLVIDDNDILDINASDVSLLPTNRITANHVGYDDDDDDDLLIDTNSGVYYAPSYDDDMLVSC